MSKGGDWDSWVRCNHNHHHHNHYHDYHHQSSFNIIITRLTTGRKAPGSAPSSAVSRWFSFKWSSISFHHANGSMITSLIHHIKADSTDADPAVQVARHVRLYANIDADDIDSNCSDANHRSSDSSGYLSREGGSGSRVGSAGATHSRSYSSSPPPSSSSTPPPSS